MAVIAEPNRGRGKPANGMDAAAATRLRGRPASFHFLREKVHAPVVSYLTPIALLIGSNVFMTTAWYWHLRYKEVPLLTVILISWGLALFEYCLAVPANRYGSAVYSAAQLKTMQEVITLMVFADFRMLSARAAHLEPCASALR